MQQRLSFDNTSAAMPFMSVYHVHCLPKLVPITSCLYFSHILLQSVFHLFVLWVQKISMVIAFFHTILMHSCAYSTYFFFDV